jgi:hypothetical protein
LIRGGFIPKWFKLLGALAHFSFGSSDGFTQLSKLSEALVYLRKISIRVRTVSPPGQVASRLRAGKRAVVWLMQTAGMSSRQLAELDKCVLIESWLEELLRNPAVREGVNMRLLFLNLN